MGFLSSLGKIVGRVARGVGSFFGLGGAPSPAPIVHQVVRPATSFGSRALSLGRRALPVAGGIVAGATAAQAFDPETGEPLSGAPGGNGRFARQTIVQTVDTMTGQVVKEKVLPGSPHLMNKDLVAAKRVMRITGKLGGRFGRRVRAPSKAKMVTEAVQDAIINRVGHTLACPS